jgi:hypothetical protein
VYVPSQDLDFQWYQVRDGCSFCWHWWDCWSSLFKLSFLYNLVSHGSTDINKCQRISKGQLKMDNPEKLAT